MDKYKDSPKATELISQMVNLADKDKFQNFIEINLPGWLIASTNKYCIDYPHFQQNWQLICRVNNVRPQKIVVVDHISFEDNHTLLNKICDVMTERGYVVRRKEEFTGCEICHAAIPVREVWQLLKDKGIPVPSTWSNTCSSCKSSSVVK